MICEHCGITLVYVARGEEFYWRAAELTPGRFPRLCDQPHRAHQPDWSGLLDERPGHVADQ